MKYPINDLEGFIAGIADKIFFIEETGSAGYLGYGFLDDLSAKFDGSTYDKLITDISKRFKISKAKKLNDIKNKFQALATEIFEDLEIDTQKAIPKNVDSLFYFFKEHVPDAPDQTIAERISDLLTKFNVTFKAKTILQRIYRAKGVLGGVW